MLRSQDDAETAVGASDTVVAISREHTCFSNVNVTASTTGERTARLHDVSVVGKPARA